MTSIDSLRALARYNRWMNDKLYALAATLGDDVRKRDCGAFFGSIHGTFNHILLGDRVWLARVEGVPAPAGFMAPGIRTLDQELYADFDELRRERALTDDRISAWVDGFTEARLAAPVAFVRRGAALECPLWWVAQQVFNHQTHHRGQITTLFMQQGHDPGSTDLFAMLLEEAAAASSH